MKLIFTLPLLICLGLSPLLLAQSAHPDQAAKAYQDSLNAYETNPATTHILPEELPAFTGLNFYPIDPLYKVKARFVADHDTHQFVLTYSKDPNVPRFVSSGKVFFNLQGKELYLHTYQNVKWVNDPAYAQHIFLPFKDHTNGVESYGGGRFLDLIMPLQGDEIVIDFNQSYNPPCAYNYYMACPIIPEENELEIEIRAGILAY